MKREFIWPAVALVAVTLIGVGGMAYLGMTQEQITVIVSMVVLPVLAALGAAQLAGQREQLSTVQQQTNGNTTRMMDIIEAQTRIIASLPALPGPSVPLNQLPPATSWPPADAETSATSWPPADGGR